MSECSVMAREAAALRGGGWEGANESVFQHTKHRASSFTLSYESKKNDLIFFETFRSPPAESRGTAFLLDLVRRKNNSISPPNLLKKHLDILLHIFLMQL